MIKNLFAILLFILVFGCACVLIFGCKEIEVTAKPVYVDYVAKNAMILKDTTLDAKVYYVYDNDGELNNIKLFKKDSLFINEQKYITIYKEYFSKKAKFLFTEYFNDSTYINYYVDATQSTAYRTLFESGNPQFIEVSIFSKTKIADASLKRLKSLFTEIDYKIIFNPPMYHIPVWRHYGK